MGVQLPLFNACEFVSFQPNCQHVIYPKHIIKNTILVFFFFFFFFSALILLYHICVPPCHIIHVPASKLNEKTMCTQKQTHKQTLRTINECFAHKNGQALRFTMRNDFIKFHFYFNCCLCMFAIEASWSPAMLLSFITFNSIIAQR